jgi:hypothetical protein
MAMRAWIGILIAACELGLLTSCGGVEFQAAMSRQDASMPPFDGSPPEADAWGADAPYEIGAASDVARPRPDAGPDASPPLEIGVADTGAPDTGSMETTIDLTPSKDAYVEDGASVDTAFGASAQLRVKGNSGGTLDRNSWVSFDISGFSSVSGARLRLWVVTLDTGNTNGIPNEILYAPTASDGWIESTMTWNAAPPSGQQVVMTTVTDSQLDTWVEVDVTVPVSTDSDGVATFVVTSPQYTGRGLTYSSREGAYKPILRITGIQR